MRYKPIVLYVLVAFALFASCTQEHSASGTDTASQLKSPPVESPSSWPDENQRYFAGSAPALADSVKALDAAGNPYAQEYQDWDRWIADNRIQGTPDYESLAESSDETVLFTYADKNGYPLPLLQLEQDLESAATMGDAEGYQKAPRKHIYAVGVMSPELRTELDRASLAVKAKYYPHVPDWLGSNPPKAAMLLADGRVVTEGDLGSVKDHSVSHGSEFPADQSNFVELPGYILWSKDGKKLDSTDGSWLNLMSENWASAMSDYYGRGWTGTLEFYKHHNQGYYSFPDKQGSILAVYDFTGKRIENPDSLQPRDEHNFMLISAEKLSLLHKAQTE